MNPIFGNERNDKNNAYTRYLIERDEMGTFGVAQKEHLYLFVVQIDGGAAFQETRTISECGFDYERAEDKIMRKLRDEFRDKVAFFNVQTFKRVI